MTRNCRSEVDCRRTSRHTVCFSNLKQSKATCLFLVLSRDDPQLLSIRSNIHVQSISTHSGIPVKRSQASQVEVFGTNCYNIITSCSMKLERNQSGHCFKSTNSLVFLIHSYSRVSMFISTFSVRDPLPILFHFLHNS